MSKTNENEHIERQQQLQKQITSLKNIADEEPATIIYSGKSILDFLRKEAQNTTKIKFLLVIIYYIVGILFYGHYEDWTLIQRLYFITVSYTTVGYGDFSPTSDAAKIFTIFYALIGIAFIFSFIAGYTGQIITQYQQKALEELDENTNDLKSPHVSKIVLSILMILFMVLIGSLFFGFNEDWTAVDSVYYCFISTMTIGYGDMNVTSDSSRLFSTFYLLISVVVVAIAIGNVSSVLLEMSLEKEKLKKLEQGLSIDSFVTLLSCDADGSGTISKIEFLIEMMVQMNGLDKNKDITPWLNKFDELDRTKDGKLDIKDLDAIIVEQNMRNLQRKNVILEKQKQATVSTIINDLLMKCNPFVLCKQNKIENTVTPAKSIKKNYDEEAQVF